MKTQQDLQLHDYLKKFLKKNDFKNKVHEFKKIAISLLLLC